MTLYLVVDDLEEAWQICRDNFRLPRPDDVRSPFDVTESMGSPIVHPEDGRIAVVLPAKDFTIHAAAKPLTIDTLSRRSAANGGRAAMNATVVQGRGAQTTLAALLSPSLQAATLTRLEMEGEGWFADEDDNM